MRRPDNPEGSLEWIAPGTALVFSVLMALLAPNYSGWFGAAIPAFSRRFLAVYPLWIALSTVALVVAAVGEQIPPLAERRALLRIVDIVLTVASILIIAGGVIALFLPVLFRAGPA